MKRAKRRPRPFDLQAMGRRFVAAWDAAEDYRISMELLEMAEGLNKHGVVADESLAQIRATLSRDYRLRPLTPALLDKLSSLVDGVEVDLDKRLLPEDER